MTAETMNTIVAISAAVTATATVAIAYFSYTNLQVSKQNARVSEQLSWFTGSMESHSQLQLMLEAKRHGTDVQMMWWDPTLQAVPKAPKHGEPVQVSPIYFFLPPELRAGTEKLKG